MIKKIRNLKFVIRNCNKGMTYVELIVVLSIFSVLSSVAIFNYGAFQDKIDNRNLVSDMALQIIQAQKSALSGLLPVQAPTILLWRPAYGLYFDLNADNKSFLYFVDLNNNNVFDDSDCTGECLNKVSITKNSFISQIDSYLGSTPTPITQPLAITFKRPNSGPVFSYADSVPLLGFDYIQITISSFKGAKAYIKTYPSGRIQIN